MTFREISERMTALGFKWHAERDGAALLGRFYKRIEVPRPCLTNDKNQICVEVFQTQFPPQEISLTVELTGEYAAELWAKLMVYSIKPEQFFAQQMNVESALVRAWSALV